MKISAKQFTAHGNTGLVQIRMEPETNFPFKPGGPEMKTGGLVITEASPGGIVGKLYAVNTTDSYLLLTDADVLVGAKQNRVLNKSMLLAPNSKTVIDVSCIERLRWQYTSRNFTSPGTTADHALRKAKASTLSSPKGSNSNTQGAVWSHINFRLSADSFTDRTESYHELMNYHKNSKGEKLPACEAEKGCNGIAVVSDGKVQCIDVFGTEEVYRYYFPMLRDSALLTARTGREAKPADIHESYFRVLDALDSCDTATNKREDGYQGAGILEMLENGYFVGFGLNIEDQLIHKVIFGK